MLYLFFSTDLFAVQPWVRGFKVPIISNGQRWTDVMIGDGDVARPEGRTAPDSAAGTATPPPAPRPDSSRPPTR
jgi:hypothetical protein